MDRRQLMSPRAPARPTALLFALTLTTWAGVWVATLAGWLAPWQGGLASTLLIYVAFTPLHEACHKNIQGGTASWAPVETMIGYLSGAMLLVPFPLFRVQHSRHHSFVNDPEKDPDYWVKSPPGIGLFLRILTILPAHYIHFFRVPTERAKSLLPNTLGVDGFLVMLLCQAGWRWGWWAPLTLWVVPAILALAMLALSFDWLPHHPHEERGRYTNATIYTADWLDVVLLMQNYHLMHHLYPRIPFYRYKEAYREFRPDLIENEARIR